MSNRGEPWRKFAQTFFLAEQPNGYFVLNDIFRFLKEESVDTEEEEASEKPEAVAIATDIAQETLEPAALAVQAAHPTVAAHPYEASLPDHLQSKTVTDLSTSEAEPVVVEEKKPVTANGIHTPPTSEQEAAPIPQAESIKQAAAESAPHAGTPRPVTPQAPQAPAPQPATVPTTQAPTSAPPAAKPAPAPAPSPKPVAPPQPKTWANLAAANSNKWGTQVAQEARGVSAAPPPAPVSAPVPKPDVTRPSAEKESGRDHSMYQAALSVSTPQCFVKVRPCHSINLFDLTTNFRVLPKSCRTRP